MLFTCYLLKFTTLLFNPSAKQSSKIKILFRDATQVIDYKSDSYEKTNLKNKINLVCNGELT